MMRRFCALALLILAIPSMVVAQFCATDPTGAPAIPTTDFDIQTALVPARIPADNGTDPVGAFRFICAAGQVSNDDPVVYPGRPGASHAHQFYGNNGTNAYSTFASQRTTGLSTCGDPANRSGYWMPAMLDGKGHVAEPDYVSIYYKRIPASDPACGDPRINPKAQGICVGIPNAIRFIFGYDMLTGTAPTGGNRFLCVQGNATVGNYANLDELAKGGCPAGDKIELMISAPACWNGLDLDSANHRDHVSYQATDRYTSFKHCPADHPYLMPRFQMNVFYTIQAGDDLSLWHLSSDEMLPNLPHGTTFHADYFEGWDNKVKAMWMDNCINRHLNCSGGNLGNGYAIRHADAPYYNGVKTYTNPNARVPVPVQP